MAFIYSASSAGRSLSESEPRAKKVYSMSTRGLFPPKKEKKKKEKKEEEEELKREAEQRTQ